MSRRSRGRKSRRTSGWHDLPGPDPPAALRPLRTLDPPAKRRLQAAIELLSGEPRPSGAKKLLGGEREWRARTGDDRIVDETDDNVLLVLALAVGHRRDIYQRR